MGYRLHVHKEHKIVYGNGRFNHGFRQILILFDVMYTKQNEEAEDKFDWDESYNSNGGYDSYCDNFEMPIEQLDYIINNIPNLTDEELKEINNNDFGPNEELTKEELLSTFIELKNEADITDGYCYFSWF